MKRLSRLLPALLISLMLTSPTHGRATEIWMGATEPIWRSVHGWPPNDFMQLFEPKSPWPHARSRVAVFEVSKRFVLEAPEDELARVITYLNRHHIDLAIQGTPLLGVRGCGLGLEGHGPPDDMLQMAERIKWLNGVVKHIANDEPLYYGHVFHGSPTRPPCISPISDLATEAARKIKGVQGLFPSIRSGDVEPIGIPEVSVDEWTRDIGAWLDAYQDAVGKPLDFMQLDVVRSRSGWLTQLKGAVSLLRAKRIPFGIIYNGVRSDQSDNDWTRDAASFSKYVENDLNIKPDQAIFQTWMDRPRRLLPESEAGTLTNLVASYHSP